MIVAIVYFTKWVEKEPIEKIDEKLIQGFIWKNICCRFDIPRILISNNGT